MTSRYFSPYYTAMTAAEHAAVRKNLAYQSGDVELAEQWKQALAYINRLAEYRWDLWHRRGGGIKNLWPTDMCRPPMAEETDAEHRRTVADIRYSGCW